MTLSELLRKVSFDELMLNEVAGQTVVFQFVCPERSQSAASDFSSTLESFRSETLNTKRVEK